MEGASRCLIVGKTVRAGTPSPSQAFQAKQIQLHLWGADMPLRELTVAVARIASDVTSLTELVEKSIRSGSPTQEATQARHYAQLLMLIEQPPMDVSVPATIRSMAQLPASSGLPDNILEYRPTPPALAGMAKLVLDMTHRNWAWCSMPAKSCRSNRQTFTTGW